MNSSGSPAPKPKRYYDSVSQQLAENSQTVRGVLKPNKNLRKTEIDKSNQPQNPNENISLASSSSSINNDSFYDDDDNISDNRLYPSCYNRQKIIVAPLGKTTASNQKQLPVSPTREPRHPK